MRAVYATDERTHVGGGAGTGDDHEVALEGFTFKSFRKEEVAGALDDAFAGEKDDVERHEQAGGSDQRASERNADRAGAGDSGEGFGHADRGGGELLVIGLEDDSG